METAGHIAHENEYSNAGGRLVAHDGRALPLVGSALRADARGGIARVVLEQRFHNPYDEPLAVTYSLPLPEDGAVSGFEFEVAGRVIVGEVDRREAARERYERALVEGRSAALIEQERGSLFTQQVGNIPPRAELVARVTVDQRLRWLADGAWEWRFPTVVSPRYMGAAGRVPDAARVAQDVSAGPLPLRATLALVVRDELASDARPESPSHPMRATRAPSGYRVEFADDAGARLDRDIVVRWAVAGVRVGLALDTARPAAGRAIAGAVYGLLTVVPPEARARGPAVPRDLIVLIDTSGSMDGRPLEQARRVVSALIETLGEDDRIELIEFSDVPRRWKRSAVAATPGARREALAWLASLRASGGTEMRAGIMEALRALRPEAQRQVVLVTDGQIGFETEVVEAIHNRLPGSSRVHTVGVGSAVNRSLTGPAARAGRGGEVIIGLDEDPERAARVLRERTDAPLVVDLEISGSALIDWAPRALPDLYAGAPALLSVKLRAEGGEIVVRGRCAAGSFWQERVRVPALGEGEGSQGVVALYARESVADLEARLAAGANRLEIDAAIERIGLDFQIATRLTSWVAVSREALVDPREPLRHEKMPHELPHGVSAEGLGLRNATYVATTTMETYENFAPPVAAMAPSPVLAAMAMSLPSSPVTGAPPPPSPARHEPFVPPSIVGKTDLDDSNADLGLPKKKGFVRRALQKLFGGGEAEQRREPKMSTDVVSESKTSAPTRDADAVELAEPARTTSARNLVSPQDAVRTLRGRVALREQDVLVIEVHVDEPGLSWDPPREIVVEWEQGTSVTVELDEARTTRKGSLAAGTVARLVLALPAGTPASAPQRIVVQMGGQRVVIEM